MTDKFPQQLKNQMIEYFQKYYSLTISDEEAEEYLCTVGGLFIAVNSLRE
jgi:hypothetical protein